MNSCSYCGKATEDSLTLTCDGCKNIFHIDCLKSGRPSTLHGDALFDFKCINCGKNGEEEIERSKLPWVTIVSLALYNLHLNGGGKKGYFRWKEHICAYIDKHWSLILGPHKKKTSLWYGTVSGALSSNCPRYFQSGSTELGEVGWWKLSDMKPPILKPNEIVARKSKRHLQPEVPVIKVEGLRSRKKKSSIELAIALKERRLLTKEAKQIRKEQSGEVPVLDEQPVTKKTKIKLEKDICVKEEDQYESTVKIKEEPLDYTESLLLNTSDLSSSSLDLLTNQDIIPEETPPDYLLQDDDTNDSSEIEIDPGGLSPLPDVLSEESLSIQDIMSTIPDQIADDVCHVPEKTIVTSIKTEPIENIKDIKEEKVEHDENMDDKDDVDNDCGDDEEDDDNLQSEEKMSIKEELDSEGEENRSETSGEYKADNKSTVIKIKQEEDIKPESPVYKAISLYDEKMLLNRLNQVAEQHQLSPQINRFRRKLLIRQAKRERGFPVFDLDYEVNKSLNIQTSQDKKLFGLQYTRFPHGDLRILDRFQGGIRYPLLFELERPSFINRLVGTEDDQLQCIRSPYTTRTLKPFIRRDYESRPIKMKLLQEIKAYHHRNEADWQPEDPHPIDYCYVRPQHIPSVNTLSQQFFWPGIDLSECLHYPDFSCVVLYRKIVIGFAFMVPDVKYNEAYISFIFTHPEWRQAGIAKFMVYHLIQTCMGKDVTLHVSATNPAMLLYQKFGFKPEEFLLDFYDKYYPVDSKECKHAFFLRLRK